MEIASNFCQYFTTLAKRITSAALSSHTDYLSKNFPHSIFFNSATKEEFINIASSFKSGKAAGHDKISISTIKQSIHCIAVPLTHIINLVSISRDNQPSTALGETTQLPALLYLICMLTAFLSPLKTKNFQQKYNWFV